MDIVKKLRENCEIGRLIKKTLLQVLSLCVFLNLKYSSKYFAQIYRVQYRAALLVYLRDISTERLENSIRVYYGVTTSSSKPLLYTNIRIFLRYLEFSEIFRKLQKNLLLFGQFPSLFSSQNTQYYHSMLEIIQFSGFPHDTYLKVVLFPLYQCRQSLPEIVYTNMTVIDGENFGVRDSKSGYF